MGTTGAVDSTLVANAIIEQHMGGFVQGVFYNDQLLNLLRFFGLDEPDPASVTGDSYKWAVAYDSNGSVETYSEHDPLPAAGAVPFIEPSLGFVNFQGVLKVTRIAEETLKDGGQFPAIAAQIPLLISAIRDLRTTTFLGSGANGLLNMVAATGSYAGITRGSAAYFESTVDSSTSAQTIAAHRTQRRTIRAGDKGGRLSVSLTTRANADIYAALGGQTVTAGTVRRVDIGGGAPNLDFGFSNLSMDDVPIVAIDDLTANSWLDLDLSEQNQLMHRVIRVMDVIPHHREGDAMVYHVTTRSQLVMPNPKTCGKFTALAS